jgi:hypothetical protein
MRRPFDRSRARLAVLAAFLLTEIYFTGFFPPSNNPNEISRIQAVVAFVDTGTFSIDDTLRRFGDHEDKAASGGHFYSNKAPGLILAAVPVYRLLRVFLPPPRSGTAPIFVVLRILTVTLVCFAALDRFSRRLAEQPETGSAAAIVTLAVAFGTPFLFYARSFFSHAWTAALLFLSWDCLRRAAVEVRPALLTGFAGLLAGWATISEYTAAPIAALIALSALADRKPRALALFCAGAVPALALALAYQSACFGSPWTLSYAREAYPDYASLARSGLFGFQAPSLQVALAFLFHPCRGVVLFSPFLLWAVPGAVLWWRSGGRLESFCAVAAVLGLFIPLTGYPNWEGGLALGSRYLLPAVFFAALLVPHALSGPLARGLFAGAAAFSIENHVLLTSSYPHVHPSVSWPAATFSPWLIARGIVAPNLGLAAGLSPALSLLLPAAALAIALYLSVRELGPTRPGRAVAVLLASACLAASLLWPPALSDLATSWRESLVTVLGR